VTVTGDATRGDASDALLQRLAAAGVDTARVGRVRMLILDVDGVLTDGGITYSDGSVEAKTFNSKDGFGLRLLMDDGVVVSAITGRASEAVRRRCRELGIAPLFEGISDKAAALDQLLEKTGTAAEDTAAAGDDLPDLPLLRRVGVAFAVADAHGAVRRRAHATTRAPGGRGAVREICDALLKARGSWTAIIDRFDK
jgi:3-deoxy-D-manno-octulosonate 8-phosphate phosphatase (KDO 8-P phosphatase)